MNPDSSSCSIGYFSPAWPLEEVPNGVVAYVADMADQLRMMGHHVTVVTGDFRGKTEDTAVYKVPRGDAERPLTQRMFEWIGYRVANRSFTDLMNRRRLGPTIGRAIAEQGIQIFEMEESFGLSSLANISSPTLVCVRLHGPWFLNGTALGAPEDEEFRHRVLAERRAIASAHAVSSSSRDVLDRTRAYYNLALEDAKVIYPPSCPVPPGELWRLEDCNPKQVLFIGRFDRHKGGDLVIEAFGRVLREVPQAHLNFVGPDYRFTDSNGREWRLEEFVRDRLPGALESGRIALLGAQPFSALMALRRSAMVTTVCSRYENAPRALIEAMSIGCPIVAARVGGIPEILEDGRDGLLHRPEDADDLAAGIIALLNDPARSAELGRSAAATCERRFHPEIIAKQTIEFYRHALRSRGGSPT